MFISPTPTERKLMHKTNLLSMIGALIASTSNKTTSNGSSINFGKAPKAYKLKSADTYKEDIERAEFNKRVDKKKAAKMTAKMTARSSQHVV